MMGLDLSRLRVLYHSARNSSSQVPRFLLVCDTIQFELDRARYVAWPCTQTSSLLPHFDHASLVTVVDCPPDPGLDLTWLQVYIHQQEQVNDVFHVAFLNGIIFTRCREPESLIAAQLPKLFGHWGTTWSAHVTDGLEQASPGLYVLKDDALWTAYRMYDDFNGVFMATTRRCLETGFSNLQLGSKEFQTLSVAVPSRTAIARTPRASPAKKLQGLRFAAKDMYRLHGLRNTLGNRAYYDVNVPATATAPTIQKLLDAGAYLVGTTKLACFTAREEPAECADFQAPFNPRGDGYQSPAGSSSGSAAAIASYEFLDFTIGSDTTGSTRRPAFFNGCFALRPTHGRLPLGGMQLTFELFGTPSLFCRDIEMCRDVAAAWIGPDEIKPQRICERGEPLLIYPLDYLPTSNHEQMKLVDAFVSDMETSLGTTACRISIEEYWKSNGPEEAGQQTIHQFLDEVATQTFLFDFYHNFQDFRDEYYNKHHKDPYINPFISWRWNLGKSITLAERNEAIHKVKIYKKWFLQEVLQEGTRHAFIVLPIADFAPNYRDTQPGPPFKQNAFDALFLAPILGAPELVVPIGQLPYDSRVSGRVEYLPVAVSVLGLPGTDLALINTVECCLRESKRETVVRTGKCVFEVRVGGV